MANYRVKAVWQRQTPDFSLKTYNRAHQLEFEGGVEVPASAPVVYGGDADRINPEQAFTGAISSCHLLTFLALAVQQGFVIDAYEDNAEGEVGKLANGHSAVVKVTLRPKLTFSGDKQPSAEELAKLHEKAHEYCFIANSVSTVIEVLPETD